MPTWRGLESESGNSANESFNRPRQRWRRCDLSEVSEPEERHYSNKLGRLYLEAIEDLMGSNGVAAVLRLAGLGNLIGNYPPDTLDRGFSFEDFAAVNEAMAEMYGPHGARGLCLRAGRAMLSSAVTEGGLMADLPDPAFSMLPAGAKVKVGLNTLAEGLSRLSDQESRLEEHGDELVFVIEKCPECWGRTSESTICHANTGMLMEALHWLIGSEEYDATEVECIARGDGACSFLVARKSEEQAGPQDIEEESSDAGGEGRTEVPVG